MNDREPNGLTKPLIEGTKLADPAVRKALRRRWSGGNRCFHRLAGPDGRKVDRFVASAFTWFGARTLQSVEQPRAGEKTRQGAFRCLRKELLIRMRPLRCVCPWPVKGYPMNGTMAPYKTTLYGLYDRAVSFDKEPFDLPKRYIDGKDKLDLAAPFNFVTTNDIIGGNSGSPVVNRNGDIVGLVFDGDIESLVGDFVYDSYQNRTVAVHTAAMTECLKKLYGAQALVDELMAK